MSERETIPIQAAMQSDHDPVTRPAHYTAGRIECIDALEAMLTREEFRGALRWNAVKYLWRLGKKGDALEDARKAQYYISRLVYELGKKHPG